MFTKHSSVHNTATTYAFLVLKGFKCRIHKYVYAQFLSSLSY